MKELIVAAFAGLALSACASLTSPARVHELDKGKNYWFDYEGSRRGMILVSSTDRAGHPVIRSCAEPSPDVALALGAAASAGGQYQGVHASGEGNVTQSVDVLGERTQMVMFFREALFRVCELSLNQNMPPDQIAGLYNEIIRTALRLGSSKALEIEFISAQNELAQMLVRKAELEFTKRQLELDIAGASAVEKKGVQLKLTAVAQESKKIDDQVVATIEDLNALSRQKFGSAVQAATEAATPDSGINERPSGTAHAP